MRDGIKDVRSPRVMILIKPSRNIKTKDPKRARYSRLRSSINSAKILWNRGHVYHVPEQPPDEWYPRHIRPTANNLVFQPVRYSIHGIFCFPVTSTHNTQKRKSSGFDGKDGTRPSSLHTSFLICSDMWKPPQAKNRGREVDPFPVNQLTILTIHLHTKWYTKNFMRRTRLLME